MEFIVFTTGDSSNPDTWSNVPYFLTTNLEKKGVKIYRTDISINSSPKIEKIFMNCLNKLIKLFTKINKSNRTYTIYRTRIYNSIVERKMRKAIKEHPNASIISLSFSNSGAKFVKNQKTCMICDWTIDYLIEIHQKRKPGFLEKKSIKRQRKEILLADYVITLFPDVQEYMERKYKRKIIYMGNVINSDLIEYNNSEIIKNKFKMNRYLFIGKEAYIKSAINLIKVIEDYNKNNNNDKIYADIIGLDKVKNKLPKSQYITYHGYLSKGVEEQRKEYYECIFNAKAIVNTTESWNGMSSLIETMYYNTPIIVVPNLNTIKTFGKKCDFGYYCKHENYNEVMKNIQSIQKMNIEEYKRMCMQSHEKVKNFTWEKYVEKIIMKLK